VLQSCQSGQWRTQSAAVRRCRPHCNDDDLPAESVPFNIVEGCGADTNKEFARFLGISFKSTMELEAELQMARDCRVLSQRDWQQLTRETIEIRRMLWGLRKKVLEGQKKPPSPKSPLAEKTDQTVDSRL
jgi:hypothetical protein